METKKDESKRQKWEVVSWKGVRFWGVYGKFQKNLNYINMQ